ncbi:MAG: MFS transporter [Stenotrophomonas maltophilia]
MSFSPPPGSFPATSHKVRNLLSVPVLSWAFYDFANTIWAFSILSLYFALWVTQDNGAPQAYFFRTLSFSMLVVAVTCPMLGAVSDRFGRRIPFLAGLVLVCVVCTGLMGRVGGLTAALVFFAIANFAYQSGNVFYDSLLATVSREDNRGRISGLGVALGYVGSISGILMIGPIESQWGRGATFLPTAVLFLLFALPCFLMVKEPSTGVPWSFHLIRDGYTQLFHTLRQFRRHANLLRFVGARFLYVDAINTMLIVMAIYVTEVLGFNSSQLRLLFITSTTFAIVGSLFYGRLADRIGPKRTLTIVLIQWMVVFVAASATFSGPLFFFIGALAGIALGGTWTADRAFLTRLAPPEQMGEFFGLYQLAGRFAAVIGPLLWSFTVDGLEDLGNLRFRIAILVLLVNVVLGFLVLMTVRPSHGEKA